MTRDPEPSGRTLTEPIDSSTAPILESIPQSFRGGDPAAAAEYIAQHPGQEPQIFARLHQSMGNTYVQQVVQALGSTQRPSTHGTPRPLAVADAGKEELNAALRVLVYSGERIVKRWDTKGHWEGPLPVTYRADRTAKGWHWDDANGRQVRVNTNRTGSGGQGVESFAGDNADRIVVYAEPLDAVTVDKDAEKTDRAPGHAATKEESGDGSTAEIKPGASGAVRGPETSTTAGASSQTNGDGTTPDARGGGGTSTADTEGDADADAFEQSIGIFPDEESEEDVTTTGKTSGGQKQWGQGRAGGDQGWRTGKDAATDGTGPGGEHAKAGGLEEGGQEDAESNEGTEHGDKDGAKLGSEHGKYDGDGGDADHGVRGAMALGGGVLGVPAALRGLVELILLWGQGDITGATSDAFKAGVTKFSSAAAARRVLASEARKAAAAETRQLMKRLANNKEWKALSAAERKQVARAAYWEVQRSYYQAYIKAARLAQREAKQALKKAKTVAGRAAARERKAAADVVAEAGEVQPVAGRLPKNHDYAGRQYPREQLPAKYRAKGVEFKESGYPDFSPYAKELPAGGKSVTIEMTGNMERDFAAANAKAGLKETPEDWVWHHSEEMGVMELVPRDLHKTVGHTGGQAAYKHMTGIQDYD